MFQKWFQLRCAKLSAFRWISLILCLSLSHSPSSWGAKKLSKVHLPGVLREIEKKYERSPTLSADFSQLNMSSTFSQKKMSSGKIYIKRPSKIRWETEKPDPNLLISNGKTYWFYTPPFDAEEPGQVIEKPASQVESKLANALLSGAFSKAQIQSIQKKTPSTYILTPSKGTAGSVQKATIQVDLKTKVIEKVILDHVGGNRSEITLSQIKLGNPLADDLFIFKAPPHTEKIED